MNYQKIIKVKFRLTMFTSEPRHVGHK